MMAAPNSCAQKAFISQLALPPGSEAAVRINLAGSLVFNQGFAALAILTSFLTACLRGAPRVDPWLNAAGRLPQGAAYPRT